jgi:protein phosphatase
MLTQFVGIPKEEYLIEPSIKILNYAVGDRFLICSDGLTDMVTVDRIRQVLTEHRGEEAAQILLNEALENGGRDNVTFILLYVAEKRRGIFQKRCGLCRRKK